MTSKVIMNKAELLASREVVITGEIPWDWFKNDDWPYREADILETRKLEYFALIPAGVLTDDERDKLYHYATEAEKRYIAQEKRLMEDKIMTDWLVKNAYSPSYAPELVKIIRRMCKEIGLEKLYDENVERLISE
ncbi:MAG: hypothetical protein E7300_03695 [Lachnospiraceae bacterium]|nr:hypothetical protein [Lachnospiraceae bacterium]